MARRWGIAIGMATEVQDPTPSAGTVARRVLTVGVPLWVVLVLLIAGALGFAFYALSEDETDLGPAFELSERVDAEVLMCNEVVDREGVDPRRAELRAQDAFRELGPEEARVRVDRRDCREP